MTYISIKATGLDSLSHQKNKKIHTHPLNPAEAKPSFRKVSYPLQNYIRFSPLTSGLESFGHKSTPSDRPWIEAYCPKF